jgi:hypothetical protein
MARSAPPPRVVLGAGEVLHVEVREISALVPQLSWSYQQLRLPRLHGEGRADAALADGVVTLGFGLVPSRVVVAGRAVPQLTLRSSSVRLAGVELAFDGSYFSWLYNVLSYLLQDAITTSLEASMAKALEAQCGKLLAKLNREMEGQWDALAGVLSHSSSDFANLAGGEGEASKI